MDQSPSVKGLVESAEALRKRLGHEKPGIFHFLIPLMDNYRGMVEDFTEGLDFHASRQEIWTRLQAKDAGASVDLDEILAAAAEKSAASGKAVVHERDFARVLLERSGWELRAEDSAAPEQPGGKADGAASPLKGPARQPTPELDRHGRDLTEEARKGKIPPVVGRDAEVRQVLETLCRTETRNPLLIGPAGVGKTAIVGELARRIAAGDIPEALKGFRLIELDKTSLTAGTPGYGQIVERVKTMLAEASSGGILLFLDEVHHLLGGDAVLGTEFANSFKPALARGDLACIAATTDAEYRRSVEKDSALSRRFQPIRIQALSPEATLDIMKSKEKRIRDDFQIQVQDGVLEWLVAFARDNMRNRFFPEKALVLLDQCISNLRLDDANELTREVAQSVATRLVGVPGPLTERLATLAESLKSSGVLADDLRERLLKRLRVTGENLDLHPQQPEAVILLAGAGGEIAAQLAGTLARDFFGGADRIISISLEKMINETDIRELLGAPPSYIGYGQELPIHKLKQMPWCVFCCTGLDACHPLIAKVVVRALNDGWFTDALGEKLYLSNAIVLLTAGLRTEAAAPIGFGRDGSSQPKEQPPAEALAASIDPCLPPVVDLIVTEAGGSGGWDDAWLRREILPVLSKTYRERGLVLEWEPSAMELMKKKAGALNSRNRFSRWVEQTVANVLMPHLNAGKSLQIATLQALGDNLAAKVEETEKKEKTQ